MEGQGQAVAQPTILPAQEWAQCENPNCNKWRLLPPGTVLNENEPWYCYMNPDVSKNTCDAPEAVRFVLRSNPSFSTFFLLSGEFSTPCSLLT